MKKIIAFAGSNSKTSINKQLATYAATLVENVQFDVADLNEYQLPIFSIDIEQEEGFPKEAIAFNELLSNYDGFVVSLAEHNGSYAAVFKNLFDWISRIDRMVFKEKPLLLMATSPGGRGGVTVLQTAENSFSHMGATDIVTFSLPSFYDNFKDNQVFGEHKEKLDAAVVAFQKLL